VLIAGAYWGNLEMGSEPVEMICYDYTVIEAVVHDRAILELPYIICCVVPQGHIGLEECAHR